jgi:hypothetical protein
MLDPTLKSSNFVFSIKKHLIENLYDAGGIELIFDEFLSPPDNINKWIFVDFGSISRNTVSQINLDIYCVSREDFESFELYRLVDLVLGCFDDSTTTDGKKRIACYDSTNPTDPIGYFLVLDIDQNPIALAKQDNSKYIVLTISFQIATK